MKIRDIIELEKGRGYLFIQYFNYLDKDIKDLIEELKKEDEMCFWLPLKNIMKRHAIEF